MSDPNDNLGVGGGMPPINPLGGPSLEAEEKAIRSGKGRMMAGMIVAVIIAAVGIVFVVASGGEDDTWSNFGRSVNGFRQTQFNPFWGCALRGANLDDIRNNSDLAAQIHRRASQGRARYARHVRDECLPKLNELGPAIQAIIPPEEMQAGVTELHDAVQALRSAWSDYIAHIEGLGDNPYDQDAANEYVTNIARGWFDYRTAHGRLNDAVSEKLGR